MTKKLCALALMLLMHGACAKSPETATTTTSQPTSSQSPVAAQANVAVNANAQPAPPSAVAAGNAAAGQTDACSLITNAEVAEIQHDQVKETKPSSTAQGDFLVSQCFYTTNNFVNSVSLSVTEPDPNKPSSPGPKKYWETTFHREGEGGERESEHERERKKRQAQPEERNQARGGGEEEEEEAAPPTKVAGVGDEAFWSASRVGGALYVLKNNSFLRISVGGTGNNDAKIQRCKALAQKALKRMR